MGFGLWICLILNSRLVFSAINKTNFPMEHRGPEINLIDVKFFTNSTFKPNYTLTESAKIYHIPVTFKEMTFSCDSHFPTSWKFHKPPFEESSIQRIVIKKHRGVRNYTEFEINRDSYIYQSNLTIKYKYFISKSLWPIACKGSNSLGYGDWSTVIQGESDPSDPLRLRINISKFDDSVAYNERRKYKPGINEGCNLTLALDTSQRKFACGVKGSNGMSRPGIISCGNKDECVSIYMLDKKSSKCRDTFETDCSHTECQSFTVESQMPGVILCYDDSGKNSIARSFFTNPINGQMGYEFWDDAEVNVSLQSLKDPDEDVREWNIFYYGQTVTFECSGSASFFSSGFQWVLFKSTGDLEVSKTSKVYLGNDIEVFSIETNLHVVTKSIKLEREYGDTIKVTCLGPRWNKFEWINQSIEFNVSEPKGPVITGAKSNLYNQGNPNNTCFNQGNCTGVQHSNTGCFSIKSFQCEAIGKPIPRFVWKVQQKSGKLLYESKLLNTNSDIACQTSKVDERMGDVVVENGSESPAVFYALIIGLTVSLVIVTIGGALQVYWMQRRGKNALLRISEAESKVFESGDPRAEGAFALPYNPNRFEIGLDEIELCMEEILGQGNFGLVVCGNYRNERVAVKMVKPHSDLHHFRALLSEIKLMCFMDKHPHLVNMVGAYTKDKQRGEAYLITEYCAKGNLLNYLKSAKTNSSCNVASVQMITWAYECTSAMEYLSVKNFIHKDLAARNVLLTEGLKAKIGDFGISKQLEDYSQEIYHLRTLTPLPLKWMAVESLRDLEFSIKTDVWSFGVLLWEIFSMGETPYPGVPNWGFDSYQLLLEGLRMNVPLGCSEEIYAIMESCWQTGPAQRPTFSELRECLLSQLIETKVNTGTGCDVYYVNSHS